MRIKEVDLKLTMTPKSILKLTSSEIKIKLIFSKIKFYVDFQQTGNLSLLVVVVDCSDTIHGRLVVNCWPVQPAKPLILMMKMAFLIFVKELELEWLE